MYDQYRPKAISASYRRKGDAVAIKLSSGVEFVIPRKLLQGLENATPTQLADVQIVEAQSGLHWDALDVDHYIPSLIEGVFGNRQWMSVIGKKGGSARSELKARAVRANGRKGGRPKAPAV